MDTLNWINVVVMFRECGVLLMTLKFAADWGKRGELSNIVRYPERSGRIAASSLV
jgi:hypothetical protein